MKWTEAEAREAIARQVRDNCTIDWETVQKGSDHIVRGVADWIENPPEWVRHVWPVVPAEREETSETKRIEAMSAINMGDTFEMLRNACYLIAKGGRPEIREITSLVLVAQAVEFEMSRAVAVSTKDGQ